MSIKAQTKTRLKNLIQPNGKAIVNPAAFEDAAYSARLQRAVDTQGRRVSNAGRALSLTESVPIIPRALLLLPDFTRVSIAASARCRASSWRASARS
jgi:hypothetical protein